MLGYREREIKFTILEKSDSSLEVGGIEKIHHSEGESFLLRNHGKQTKAIERKV